MNEDRTVFGLKLKEGLNEWTEPAASASYSGFSFIEAKDLFNLIHYYDCIAEVDVPDREKVTQELCGGYSELQSKRIIIKNIRKITDLSVIEEFKGYKKFLNKMLDKVAKEGDLKCFDALVSLKWYSQSVLNHALIVASKNGHLEIIKKLITLLDEKGIEVLNHRVTFYAILEASRNNQLEVVRHFIEMGLDLNREISLWFGYSVNIGEEALFSAFNCGYNEIATLIMQQGVHLDHRRSEIILVNAARSGRKEIVCTLIEQSHEFDEETLCIAIREAADNKHLPIVRILINEADSKKSLSEKENGATLTVQKNDPLSEPLIDF